MKRAHSWLAIFVLLSSAVTGVAGTGYAGSSESFEVALGSADVRLVGEQEQDWAAYSTSPAGDVNGDGYDDILIGAPMAGNKRPGDPPKGEGKVYLVLGRPQGQWPANPINLSQADASFLGCAVGSMTGRQNYSAGDVNGDGYDDLLISGWKCSVDKPLQGKAYLFLGRPNVDWGQDYPVEQADASFLGEGEGDHAAYFVHTAGDVNGDGYDDMLIAAPHNSDSADMAGQIYLVLGKPDADWGLNYPLSQADASFLGEFAQDRAGRSAAGVGDVNGDGYADWLIGSILNDEGGQDAGQAYLILGRAAADWGMDVPLSQADASFVGEAVEDELGRRVAGAGDINGDGLHDLIIAASRHDEVGVDFGKAYLLLGRPAADWGLDFPVAQADASFLGESALDQAGRRVSSAGDFNDDGFGDLIIGAPHCSRSGEAAGCAYLIFGRALVDWGQDYPLEDADAIYVGEEALDVAGYEVASAGDVDGDGKDDLLVGAYGGRLDKALDDGEPGDGGGMDLASAGKAYLLLSHARQAPGIPVQVAPPNGTVTNQHNVLFQWRAGTGGLPAGYKINLDGTLYLVYGTSWLRFLESGVHTWRVRAFNNFGASAWSQAWTVDVAAVPPKMYVGNIKMNYTFVPPNYKVQALVPVWDESGVPVGGAAVTAEWTLPDGSRSVQTSVTPVKGTAFFSRQSALTGLYAITILDIQKNGYLYDPAMNQETSEEITVP